MPLAADFVTDRQGADDLGLRGSNQSGMRDHNERLVLSLLRQHGALAKSDIARITGLSAQTISVIMRALEQDGLLLRGEPVRGRIGQPSVPMHLNPEGALFLGLKIGRRSTDLVLVDFMGRVRDSRRKTYRYPTPGGIVAFVGEALPELMQGLPATCGHGSAAWVWPCHSSCGTGCKPWARRSRKWTLGAIATFRPIWPRSPQCRSMCKTTPPPPVGQNWSSAPGISHGIFCISTLVPLSAVGWY